MAATDRQIDALVYELYDLTEDEIAIVEEATGK
jgi:type II restriction/modification system DNA methylase subunit YeeA